MGVLTVTARGQVTFRQDVLRHLGIQPGEKIEFEKLPGGQVTLKAARRGTIDDFIANVVINQSAVQAGLSLLQEGGDFADGLIAYDGAWLGGETFVSFDKQAITLLSRQGRKARLLDG